MASSFTTNKGIEKPASGDYIDAWATPINADWDDVDTAFGGTTTISVTGVTSPVVLTLAQYRPLNIEFTGSLTTDIDYQLPSGIGGIWAINNIPTAFPNQFLFFSILSGNTLLLPPGRSLVVSDGVNVTFAAASVVTGVFTGTLGSPGGSSASINCAYTVIGTIVTIWKTDDTLITVSTGGTGQLQLTGLPLAVQPLNSAGQNSGYITGYIGGSFFELASGTAGSTVGFATLDIVSGKLQRNLFGFGSSVFCGLQNMTLTYPLD